MSGEEGDKGLWGDVFGVACEVCVSISSGRVWGAYFWW